jgi:hypothetical protein
VARGWESKSVQEQIDAAKSRHGDKTTHLSKEQLDQQKKLESLLLHRTRVMRDIQGCKDERYRKTLNDGLAFLETQLNRLGWKA